MPRNKRTRYSTKKPDNQLVKSEKPAKVWGAGTIPLNGVDLEAFVLEDGTPLIGARKMNRLFGE